MMDTQREKRVSRPRMIYSPSDKSARPTHFLLHFESTDSYNIALSSSISNVTGKTATLNIRGKKTIATIITSGTLETCENEQKKRTRESQENFDEGLSDDENEFLDMHLSSRKEIPINTFPSSTHQAATHIERRARLLSNDENADRIPDSDDDDDDDEIGPQIGRPAQSGVAYSLNGKSTVNEKKRKQSRATSTNPKRPRKDGVNNRGAEDNQVTACSNPATIDGFKNKDFFNQIGNQIGLFQNHVTKSLHKMEKKLDLHLGSNPFQGSKALDRYRTDKGEVFPTEYMHERVNLLNTPAKDLIDFARNTLKILFTEEELKTHILPPPRDHLRFPSLEQARFDKMIEATRIKFRLNSDLMQECFKNLIRTKLSNFLYEERRREPRKLARNYERRSRQNLVERNQSDHQESIDGEEGEQLN